MSGGAVEGGGKCRAEMVRAMRGHVVRLSKEPKSHVMIHALVKAPPEIAKPLVGELLERGLGPLLAFAQDKFGSRILIAVFEVRRVPTALSPWLPLALISEQS